MIRERQLTAGPGGRILTNANVWSADSQWLVYDTRSDASGSVFDGTRIECVHRQTGEVRILYESRNGACCGVATWHPHEPRVIFILGPEQPTPDWSYSPCHRQGVIVDARRPGAAITLDARDIVPPFTPGALRGGSHVHIWHPLGDWVSFTYEDHVLESAQATNPAAERNRRTVAVAVPGHPVTVPKSSPRNHDGIAFSVVVAATTDHPRPGSDDLSRAFEDAWVGQRGYRRADGCWQTRALAFFGDVTRLDGRKSTELFLLELPEDLTQPGLGPLEGTPTQMPFPPAGVLQRRLTGGEDDPDPGVHGPRHWPRSSPDGAKIGFLKRDPRGIVQFWMISPAGGPAQKISDHPFSVASAFTWHPNGRHVTYIGNQSICLTDTHTGDTRLLTQPGGDPLQPEACVFSPDGTAIAAIRRVRENGTEFNQIVIVEGIDI